MKSKLLSILLAFTMLISSSSTMLSNVFAEVREDIATPVTSVAKKANGETYTFEELTKNLDSNIYKSEEAYKMSVEAQASKDAEMSIYDDYDYTSDEEVVQTFTVIDWKNQQPISGAILLVNGTPRFTDFDGKVRIREYKGKDILVRVETMEYLPYIAYFQVKGDEKTIEVKKPNHDIEIYDATLEYEGTYFNLIDQPCNVNLNILDSCFGITVESNVVCEEYCLYVNGEPSFFAYNNVFDAIDWSSFNIGDKVELTGTYQGIESERVELNLSFVKNEKLEVDVGGEDDKPIGGNIPNGMDYGILGGINIDFKKYINSLFADEMMNTGGTSITLGKNHTLSFNYYYDPNEGTIEYILGYSYRAISDEKRIEKLQNEIKENDSELKKLREESYQLQRDLAEQKKNKADVDAMKKAQKAWDDYNEKLAKYPKYANSSNAKHDLQKLIKVDKDDYKKAVDALSTITDKINNGKTYDQLRQERDKIKNINKKNNEKINAIKNSNFEFTLDLEFSGTFKYSLVKNAYVDFKIAGGVNVNLTFSGNFTIYVIPCMWEITIHGGAHIQLYLLKDGQWITAQNFFDRLRVQLAIGIGGEIGVGASLGPLGKVGVVGYVDTDFEFELWVYDKKFHGNGDFFFSLGVKAYILLWDYNVGHTWKTPLFDTEESSSSVAVALMARQCVIRQNELNGERLADNLYPASISNVQKVGDNYVMTWVEDSLSRDEYNRTRLMYSVFDGQAWSEAKPIYDDGRCDFYQDVISDGKNLYVTWQKINKSMTYEDSYIDYTKNSDIVLSKFNNETKTFEAPKFITRDDKADMFPTFALKENSADPLTVVWHSNSENNILGLTGLNSIYYASENTNWKPELLLDNADNFGWLSAAYVDGELTCAYLIDSDGNYMTSDSYIRLVTPDSVTDLTECGVTSAQFLTIEGKSVITYYNSDGYLCRLNNEGSNCVMIDGGMQNAYNYVENENGKLMFYAMHDGYSKQAYCSIYDEQNKEWTAGICVTDETNTVLNPTGWLNDDGSITVIYNVQDKEGNTALCHTTKEIQTSILINDAFVSKTEDGYDLDVEIENVGDTKIDTIRLTLFGEETDIVLNSPLKIGEARYLTFSFTPNDATATIITVSVLKNNIITASADYYLQIKYPDLILTGEYKIVDGKQIINIGLTNASDVSVEKARLQMFVNGNLISDSEILMSDGDYSEQIILNDIRKDDYIYFKVITEVDEITKINNDYGIFAIKDEILPVDLSELQLLMKCAKQIMR